MNKVDWNTVVDAIVDIIDDPASDRAKRETILRQFEDRLASGALTMFAKLVLFDPEED